MSYTGDPDDFPLGPPPVPNYGPSPKKTDEGFSRVAITTQCSWCGTRNKESLKTCKGCNRINPDHIRPFRAWDRSRDYED